MGPHCLLEIEISLPGSHSVKDQIVNLQFQAMRSAVVVNAAAEDLQTNGRGWAPGKLYLWTLKFECHKIFTCRELLLFF